MGLAGAATPGIERMPGRLLWRIPHPVWEHGDDRCRTVQDGPVRLAVAGHCYATSRHLEQALTAVRARRWADLTRWPGSYWVAATDGASTVVIGDLAGARPVYYARCDGATVWAVDARLLADRIGAGIDLGQLTAWLVAPTVPELLGDATPYRGVALVPPGWLLELPAGAPACYEPPTANPSGNAEGAAQLCLRQAITVAVADRVASHPRLTADLSGGVDSTSVTALAARSGPQRVPVFTHQPYQACSDDVVHARAAAEQLPGLIHRVVTGGKRWFDDLDQVPVTGLPYGDAARWAVHSEYLGTIAVEGSDAHLTGGGGDTLFAPPSYALADLARAGLWRRWMSETAARARLRHRPVASSLAAGLASAACSYPDALRRLGRVIAGARRARPRPGTVWLPTPGIAAWLTPDVAADLADQLAQVARRAQLLPGRLQAAHRLRCELAEYGTYHAQYAQAARQAGVDLHAPLLDNEVVRAALARPACERLSPHVPKPQLATALTGVVPPGILARATKASLAGTAYAGVAANRDMLHDLVANGFLVASGVIDAAAVEEDLAKLAAGVPSRMAPLETLVSAELWLASTRAETHRKGEPCSR
ncbi:albusnodin/ikarugamycin family macrolactam cyclase [Nonomuraea lactucae]|uniref:albusnodin/ikarugamycin family macrolactam cyclase n=1 Tax=Nonomuraea lactucae TaxID=2249762 RepID=UPI000DE22083|nr:albusnodin/ikarugamycin family macrolactam cyclase [Nonomuraea lactucae]